MEPRTITIKRRTYNIVPGVIFPNKTIFPRKFNLENANLQGAKLERAVLLEANLENADLQRVNFIRAQLERARFLRANLQDADLSGANLKNTVFIFTNLAGANLTGADLTFANLRNADLEGAILTGAILTGANLEGANITYANLQGAIDADLEGTIDRQQQRQQQMESHEQIMRRVAEAAQEPIIESEYPECTICMSLMNNTDGPGPLNNCTQNCNDAVKVCQNGHIFHRGCILNSCDPDNRTVWEQQFRRRDNCPLCQQPLLFDCNTFKDINIVTPVSDEELREYKIQNGGNKRKRRKTLRRKILKKKKSKRKTLKKKY
jgi:hypothetical protein